MASVTQQWLEGYDDARIAMTLFFDGYPLAFTTSDDVVGIDNSLTDAPHTSFQGGVYGGLQIVGTFEQGIDLFTPDIEPPTLEFIITDADDMLLRSLLKEGDTGALSTFLRNDLSAAETSLLEVQSTDAFTTPATVYCGHEQISAGSKVGAPDPSFGTLTRGVNGLFTTESGSRWRPAHVRTDSGTVGSTTSPEVRSSPKTWVGRYVQLLLQHYDPLVGGWCINTSGLQAWVGRIETYRDNGDGTITIKCKHVLQVLNQPVMTQQWKGFVRRAGQTLADGQVGVLAVNYTAAAYAPVTALTSLAGIILPHETLAAAIVTQLQAWQTSATIHAGDSWGLSLRQMGDGTTRYVVSLFANTTPATGVVALGLSKTAWSNLGFTAAPTATALLSGNQTVESRQLTATDSTNATLELVADEPPLEYSIATYSQTAVDPAPATIFIEDALGAWANQPASSVPGVPEAEGCVAIGDVVYAVKYQEATSPVTVQLVAKLNFVTGEFERGWTLGHDDERQLSVRLGASTSQPALRQVWYERGFAGDVVLRLLMSSGSLLFNSSTYDVYSSTGMGLNVPWSLVDVDSFDRLNEADVRLLIDGATPLYKVLEPWLAATNCYMIWRPSSATAQPKIACVSPSYESSYQSQWQLTEANKAGATTDPQGTVIDPDRTTCERAADGIVNRVVFEYGHDLAGKNATTIEVNALASQTDFGVRRTLKVAAKGLTKASAEDLLANIVAPAFAYLSRPLAIIERSCDVSLMRMAPGDSVALTDSYLANPLTGVRGGTIYCWVLKTRWDFRTGRGSAQFIFLPERDPSRTATWAPSARVDEGSTNAGYIVASKELTLKAHEFSEASAQNDYDYFKVGDFIRVRQLDAAAPLTWTDIIASISGPGKLRVVAGLAGWDNTKRYVLEYDDISSASNAGQRDHAFIADDADRSTGLVSAPKPYLWGRDYPLVKALPIYTVGPFEPDTLYDDKGEPLSAHKFFYLAQALNALLSFKTSPNYIQDPITEQSQAGVANYKLVYTICVPLFGHDAGGARRLKVRMRGRQSGGGTAQLVLLSSVQQPQGSSFLFPTLPAGNSVVASITSATNVWAAEGSLSPVPFRAGDTILRTYLSIFIRGSAVGTTAFVNGCSVGEDDL